MRKWEEEEYFFLLHFRSLSSLFLPRSFSSLHSLLSLHSSSLFLSPAFSPSLPLSPHLSSFSSRLSLPLALSLTTEIPSRGETGRKASLSRDFRLSSPFLYLYLSLSLSLVMETNSVAEKSEERPSLPIFSLRTLFFSLLSPLLPSLFSFLSLLFFLLSLSPLSLPPATKIFQSRGEAGGVSSSSPCFVATTPSAVEREK